MQMSFLRAHFLLLAGSLCMAAGSGCTMTAGDLTRGNKAATGVQVAGTREVTLGISGLT